MGKGHSAAHFQILRDSGVAQERQDRLVLVEVRKRQEKLALSGVEGNTLAGVEDLRDNATAYATQQAGQTVLPAFLALGGFTAETLAFCAQVGVATAEQINYAWLAEA